MTQASNDNDMQFFLHWYEGWQTTPELGVVIITWSFKISVNKCQYLENSTM